MVSFHRRESIGHAKVSLLLCIWAQLLIEVFFFLRELLIEVSW